MSNAGRSGAGAWIDGAIGVAVLVAVAIAVAIGRVEVAVGAVVVGIAAIGIRASFTTAADPAPPPEVEPPGPRVLVIDVSERSDARRRDDTSAQ